MFRQRSQCSAVIPNAREMSGRSPLRTPAECLQAVSSPQSRSGDLGQSPGATEQSSAKSRQTESMVRALKAEAHMWRSTEGIFESLAEKCPVPHEKKTTNEGQGKNHIPTRYSRKTL